MIIDLFSNIYIYIIIFTYILYLIVFIGLIQLNHTYLRLFSSFIQLCIALFLIIKFNPFSKHQFVKKDSRIIFSSGIFLLINLGTTELFIRFYNDIKSNWIILPSNDTRENDTRENDTRENDTRENEK